MQLFGDSNSLMRNVTFSYNMLYCLATYDIAKKYNLDNIWSAIDLSSPSSPSSAPVANVPFNKVPSNSNLNFNLHNNKLMNNSNGVNLVDTILDWFNFGKAYDALGSYLPTKLTTTKTNSTYKNLSNIAKPKTNLAQTNKNSASIQNNSIITNTVNSNKSPQNISEKITIEKQKNKDNANSVAESNDLQVAVADVSRSSTIKETKTQPINSTVNKKTTNNSNLKSNTVNSNAKNTVVDKNINKQDNKSQLLETNTNSERQKIQSNISNSKNNNKNGLTSLNSSTINNLLSTNNDKNTSNTTIIPAENMYNNYNEKNISNTIIPAENKPNNNYNDKNTSNKLNIDNKDVGDVNVIKLNNTAQIMTKNNINNNTNISSNNINISAAKPLNITSSVYKQIKIYAQQNNMSSAQVINDIKKTNSVPSQLASMINGSSAIASTMNNTTNTGNISDNKLPKPVASVGTGKTEIDYNKILREALNNILLKSRTSNFDVNDYQKQIESVKKALEAKARGHLSKSLESTNRKQLNKLSSAEMNSFVEQANLLLSTENNK